MFSQLWVAYSYLAKEGALGEVSTTQRISHEFRREMSSFLKWALLTPTQKSTLRKEKSVIYDGMSMRAHGNSISLGKPMISSFTKKISEDRKGILTFLYEWAKRRKFWKTRTFRGEVDFHMLQSCLGQDQLQNR